MNQNISTLVLLVISVAIFFIYTVPTFNSIQTIRSQLEGYDQIEKRIDDLIEKQDEKKYSYKNFTDEHEEDLKKVVPLDRDDARTLMNLSSVIDESEGINIDNMRVLDSSPYDRPGLVSGRSDLPFKLKTVELTMIANYKNFAVFLTNLQENKRIFDPVNIIMVFDEDGSKIFRMNINTYWIEI